jgi:hypothetical protein
VEIKKQILVENRHYRIKAKSNTQHGISIIGKENVRKEGQREIP